MILHINLRSRNVASLICLVALVVVGTFSSSPVRLKPNGGYNIVVAVEKDTPKPTNPVIYMNKIRMIFQTMSAGTFASTKKRFHVNSVQLLVPRHWNMLYWPATTQSYETADVRISNKFKYLRAENPNSCGLPGHYIESPVEFFEHSGWDSYFGTPWKAFMSQWARYRYGIWEEHGYPGDDRFPYFYRKLGQKGWLTTGCSDVDLPGNYTTLDNKPCNTDEDEHPGDNCRFYPEREYSPATSSLMHMHWIEDVMEFCNETTHNRDAPNRQNRNCGHLSAWEVIRESSDYLFPTEPPPFQIPSIEVEIFSDSLTPDIYFLQDIRESKVPDKLRRAVQSKIGELFTRGKIYPENIAKIASFPADSSNKSNLILTTTVEWNPVENEDLFLSALRSTKYKGAQEADFSLGILDAVEECAAKQSPAGCILIVVKAADNKRVLDMTFEQDVLSKLQENPAIKLYAVEVSVEKPVNNLGRIAEVSGGKQLSITTVTDINKKLGPIVNEIAKLCTVVKDPEPGISSFRNVYRGSLLPNTVNEVPVLTPGLEDLEFYLTTAAKIKDDQLYVYSSKWGYKKTLVSSVSVTHEWNENLSPDRRYVYSWKVRNLEKKMFPWRVYYECEESTRLQCEGLLHINGRVIKEDPSIGSADDDNEDIVLDVTTSEPIVNMTRKGFSSSPFNIFVSAHKRGQPVTDLEVVATVYKGVYRESIALSDNGLASPDLYPNDGIYSASYIPPQDGDYKIFAWVRNRECAEDSGAPSNGINLLLPDQKNIGCFPNSMDQAGSDSACVGTKVMGKYGRVVSLRGIVRVTNTEDFVPGRPYRTLDLRGDLNPTSGIITLAFASPGVVGNGNEGANYKVYHSPSSEDLIRNLDDSLLLRKDVLYPAKAEGHLELIRFRPDSYDIKYYAIETTFNGLRSGPSNIISLGGIDQSVPTLPTTPKIVSPSPTATTAFSFISSTPEESQQPDDPAPSKERLTTTVVIGIVLGSLSLILVMIYLGWKALYQSKYSTKTKTTIITGTAAVTDSYPNRSGATTVPKP